MDHDPQTGHNAGSFSRDNDYRLGVDDHKISREHTCKDGLSDLDLLSAYKRTHDDRYFGQLYYRYKHKVYAKCISMLRNEMQAGDAVQEIFVKVFLNISRFKEDSRFSTWVYSITYNHCIDRIRRNKRHAKLFTDEADQPPEQVDDGVAEKVLLEMEVNRLEKVLENIPVGDKAVLMMKYQDGMKIREIGDALGKTESAIKMKLVRAKQKAHDVYVNLFNERITR